ANPDGYTVFLAVSNILTANPSLYKLSFDVEKDLLPVAKIAVAEAIVVVNPATGIRQLSDLKSFSKRQPGGINYGSSGVGSTVHLGGALLAKRMDMDATHIAYRGAGPAITALLGGEVSMMVASVPSAGEFAKSGKLTALASAGSDRAKSFPDLPTV